MKIRTGFVTNSSSSSFLIVLAHKPENAKDLQKMLFGDRKFHVHPYAANDLDKEFWGGKGVVDDENISATNILAEKVFDSLKDEKTYSAEQIDEICEKLNGCADGDPILTNWSTKDTIDNYDNITKASSAYRQALVKYFLSLYSGVVYTVEYSDNNKDDGALLEHGNVFAEVPHIQFSNH